MASLDITNKIKENIRLTVKGKDEAIDLVIISLIAGGHVLIEDVPGLGKTTLASALAQSLGCSYGRIQFTPDVLPGDISGFTTFNMMNGEKEFHKGAVENQIVLADEINRASPKTQSALLEAMQERQVTVDGNTIVLPKPFMVLATQNPVDMAGTYPLPEAQMDRFIMRISMGYPEREDEIDILKARRSVTHEDKLSPVASSQDIIAVQEAVEKVNVEYDVLDYAVRIVEATRNYEGVLLGSSPRGSIALVRTASAKALCDGRNYVTPDDIKYLAPHVLSHRIIMRNRSGSSGITAKSVIDKILEEVKVPRV